MDKIIQRTSTALLLAITLSVAGQPKHSFNGGYSGKQADNIAFPIGGMGAGMFCLEGTGAISHFSIYNAPDVFNEPPLFAALSDGRQAKVLEGPVPDRKKFGMPNSAQGVYYTTWGLPRFSRSLSFRARFPFAEIGLRDAQWPVQVAITGWSPFIPTDQDNSGLPAGALEYSFTNGTDKPLKYVFSYSAKRFNGFREIGAVDGGFVFYKGDKAGDKCACPGIRRQFLPDGAQCLDHMILDSRGRNSQPSGDLFMFETLLATKGIDQSLLRRQLRHHRLQLLLHGPQRLGILRIRYGSLPL